MPLLFSLCFGEGIVNDATSVVLLAAVKHFAMPRAVPQPPSPPPTPSPPELKATSVIAAGLQGLINLFLNETSSLINSTVASLPPPTDTHHHSSIGVNADSPMAPVTADTSATASTVGDAAAAAFAVENTTFMSPPSFPPLAPEVIDTSAAALGTFSYSLLTGFTSMLFFSLSLGCVAGLGIAVLLSSQTSARGAHHVSGIMTGVCGVGHVYVGIQNMLF